MAKKPNYDFEKRKKEQERQKKKEAKREERLARKREGNGEFLPGIDDAEAAPAAEGEPE